MEDDGNQVWFENNLDLSSLSYEQFTVFLFDRPIVPEGENSVNERWSLFRGEFDGFEASNPTRVVTQMLTAFQNWGELAKIYSYGQMAQGSSFTLFGQLRCHSHLFDPSVDLARRIECIESMYHPFADVVQHRPQRLNADSRLLYPSEEDDYFMWWDSILWDFWFHVDYDKKSILSDDLHQILDAAHATLSRILQLDDGYCQLCALHGLSHSKHPLAAETVQKYLDAHRSFLAAEDIEYVELCRDGKAL